MSKSKVTPDPIGDTPRQIEDKVRANPDNQGLNEDKMWKLIDEEVELARKEGRLRDVDDYHEGDGGDVHGKA